jgi:DNA-binding MarR family transcriptional regulator
MVHVTETMGGRVARRRSRAPTRDQDPVARIVAEFEPVMARTRTAVSRVWQDRSVSKTAIVVLIQLQRHGPMPMGRAAGLLDVGLPNMTGIITRMEEQGLVERVRDEHDRRIVLVRATDRGRAIVAALEAAGLQYLERLLRALGPGEQGICLRAFRALRSASDRLEDEEASGTSPPLSGGMSGAGPDRDQRGTTRG